MLASLAFAAGFGFAYARFACIRCWFWVCLCLLCSHSLLAFFERRRWNNNDRYSVIVIDTPPTFGPLMNSALNAADKLVVPVVSGYFALIGIKELLAEVEEIKQGANPRLEILGYLLTLVDPTNIANQTRDTLVANFGELLFESRIRRSVKLKEAPALGRTIFHHAPESAGVRDYLGLALEVSARLGTGEIPSRSG